MSLVRPIFGFNVIQELLLGQTGGMEVVTVIADLLREAMGIENYKVEAIVNFVQTEDTDPDHVPVRVGRHSVVIHPGQHGSNVRCQLNSPHRWHGLR